MRNALCSPLSRLADQVMADLQLIRAVGIRGLPRLHVKVREGYFDEGVLWTLESDTVVHFKYTETCPLKLTNMLVLQLSHQQVLFSRDNQSDVIP